MPNVEDPIPFGALLMQYRIAAGLTQEALAERTGLGVRSIQYLEGGARLPHRETVARLIRGLGLTGEDRNHFAQLAQPTPRPREAVSIPGGELPVEVSRHRAPRHNLPASLTSFVGRAQEMGEVKRLLVFHRLVMLTGTGGCGKTRLALQVAAELVDQFADGVWFVDLAPLNDPLLVPQAVAAILNVGEIPGRPMVTTLVESIGSRHLLLLIDNCEHLIESCARLVDSLLQNCVRVSVLATSRERLGARGETAFRVPSLALPDPRSTLSVEDLREIEAVSLFVDRARAVVPTFDLTPGNAAALAQVCLRLDGIPLAVELAATRVRVLTVEQIATRLDDRFRLLTGGSRTALRRQQTLRALIDWSHDLLSSAERVLFRRLVVFAGGWTLEAAELVGSGEDIQPDEILDLLTGLVDKSMVVYAGQGEAMRYHFLETIRAYAGEKLIETGEVDRIRDRHRDWCLSLIATADSELFGPATRIWLDRLEADYANLRAAVEWCRETDAEVGLQLVGNLWRYWYLRNRMEGYHWLTEMLARAPQTSIARGKALLGAGFCARNLGALSEARTWTEQSLAIARATKDDGLASWALHNLGVIMTIARDYTSARSHLEESVVLGRHVGDKVLEGTSLRDLGHLARVEGDYDRATVLYEASLTLLRAAGYRASTVWTLQGIGNLARQKKDIARARRAFEEAAALEGADMAPHPAIFSLRALGDLERSAGNFDDARTHFRVILATVKDDLMNLWSGRGVTGCLYSMGTLLLQCGSYGVGVRLAAFGSEHQRDPVNYLPEDIADHDTAVQLARVALGEVAFSAACAEGKALSLAEAVAWALSEGTNA